MGAPSVSLTDAALAPSHVMLGHAAFQDLPDAREQDMHCKTSACIDTTALLQFTPHRWRRCPDFNEHMVLGAACDGYHAVTHVKL